LHLADLTLLCEDHVFGESFHAVVVCLVAQDASHLDGLSVVDRHVS
jgi:hypothetical protein